MIHPSPAWSFTAARSLTKWYGNVHLLEDCAVGQWFAIDRASGRLLWERQFRRANSIFRIVDDVILATETRSDGPWTFDFGCSAIGQRSGDLLWEWHGRGLRAKIARWLDYVPFLTNELRPSFVGVRGAECITTSGDVLSIRSGAPLRREKDLQPWKAEPYPSTIEQRFYMGQPIEIAPSLQLGKVQGDKSQGEHMKLQLTDSAGAIRWSWCLHYLNLFPKTNFYGWRLLGSHVLFLGSEEPDLVPDPSGSPHYVANPTIYHLIVLDALTGVPIQRFQVSPEKLTECRIEDVDPSGLLLSYAGKRLCYHPIDRSP